MKQLGVLFILATLFFANTGKSQYSEYFKRQDPKEIAAIKKMGYAACNIYLISSGAQTPYGGYKYDNDGRLIYVGTPMHHEVIKYNAATGRIAYWMDSAFDGRRFFMTEHTFNYDQDGKPSEFIIGKNKSTFTFDPVKSELTESIASPSGHIGQCVYKYNPENKLMEENCYDARGTLVKRKKYTYNKYGDLFSEIEVAINNDGSKDSILKVYTFNSKGQLIRKQINTTHLNPVDVSDVNRSESNPNGSSTLIYIYNYTYNMNGNRMSEQMTCSDIQKNYKITWEYDTVGLVVKETKFDHANRAVQILSFKYR